MIQINSCPQCSSTQRTLIQNQVHNDRYLNLVNEKLNKLNRCWYKCYQCGLFYRNQFLSDSEQKTLYTKYRDKAFRQESPDDYFERISSFDNSVSENFMKLNFLINNFGKEIFLNPKKILDIGCGGGLFLAKIKEFFENANIYGIEPNPVFSDLARRKLGLSSTELLTDYFKPGLFKFKFNLITILDVFEHVDKPKEFLKDIYFSLDDNSILYMEVPSATCFKKLEKTQDIFLAPHHIFYAKEHIQKFLEDTGFKNIIVNDFKYETSGEYKIRAIANKA